MELGMVVHACNPNIQEVDEGGQGFKASFSCIATFWLAWVTCVKPKTGGGSPVGFGCLFAMRNCQA